jgi:signal transduction histidine kinase
LFAATSGFFLAKRSLAPVALMAAQAAKISESNLHERLPVEGGEELIGLAKVVNELLDRLEQAFAQQRRFVADASHELRTPTAILRTEADVTLAREHREEGEYRASMEVMRDATRRLTRVVDDLFLLARADAGHLVARQEPLYLDELVDDAVRGVRSVAEARGLRLELNQLVDSPLNGDPDLLGRVVLNLLDNAIKYSSPGGSIAVRVARDDVGYAVSVVDDGPGIPPAAQPHIFERFFRVDAARSRADSSGEIATSGAGLGLAIARRIAEVHGGSLTLVASRRGHTEFRLVLPAGESD